MHVCVCVQSRFLNQGTWRVAAKYGITCIPSCSVWMLWREPGDWIIVQLSNRSLWQTFMYSLAPNSFSSSAAEKKNWISYYMYVVLNQHKKISVFLPDIQLAKSFCTQSLHDAPLQARLQMAHSCVCCAVKVLQHVYSCTLNPEHPGFSIILHLFRRVKYGSSKSNEGY